MRKLLTIQPGLCRGEWLGLPDGLVIDWSDDFGLRLFVYYKNPTKKELEDFAVGRRFDVAFKDVEGIGFFSFRFGEHPWGDCSFTPNFYSPAPEFKESEAGKGYSFTIMLVDTALGELKLVRSVTMSKDFTDAFREWCLCSMDKNIGKKHYNAVVEKVQKIYPTAETIAEVADFRWTHTHREEQRVKEEHQHEYE